MFVIVFSINQDKKKKSINNFKLKDIIVAFQKISIL